ncbi:MAG: glycosyltransferase family 4 protein [Cytophagales bacterium]|nr:glycosyltransferase family 4 protein [Cytophagales bacterium]
MNTLQCGGGAEKVAVSLAICLKVLFRIDLRIVYIWNEPDSDQEIGSFIDSKYLPALLDKHGIEHKWLGKRPNSGKRGIITVFKNLRDHIRDYKPHIVHSHCFHPDFFNALLPHKALRVRTLHNQIYAMKGEKLLEYGIFAHRFRANVAVASSLKELWEGKTLAPASRMFFISNPIGRCFFEEARLRHSCPRVPRLGLVGRMVKQKGHIYALEFLERLHEQGVPSHLYLAGGGNLEKSLRNYVRERGIRGVHFLGPLSEQEVFELYHKLDILLVPSLWEGFNLTAYEAAATGLPVLGTDVVGLKDLLQETDGNSFPPQDIEAMCEAFWNLYKNSKTYQTQSQKGIQYTQKLTEKNIAQDYHRLYQNLYSSVNRT